MPTETYHTLTKVAKADSRPPGATMSKEPQSVRDLFVHFFGQLDDQKVPYVVLHSYHDFPDRFSSDVDYAIANSSWEQVTAMHRELGRWGAWRRVQCLQHESTASYDVFMHRLIPGCNLKLDFCSHYLRNGTLLLTDAALLERRGYHNGFAVPAPDVEFAYILAKALAKDKDINTLKGTLRRLQSEDTPGCRTRVEELVGDEGADQVDAYLAADDAALDVPSLRRRLLQRRKANLGLKLAESVRIMRRLIFPTGFSIAILGPDGVGKSTLIDGLRRTMLPAFRRIDQLHFRPKTFEPKGDDSPHTNPHGAKPRPAPVALAKLFYYYLDHLFGYLTIVRPLKCRSSLVIFDRCFDDIIVDPRRFRIGGFTLIARMLRRLLPKHDLVIVLDASPEVVFARKRELSLDELRRQRQVFASFVTQKSNYLQIDAGREPEAVLASCYGAVVDAMAKRLN